MERGLLSVIILNYNNGDYIYETLESVISQTYPFIEIIICDDCSSDFPEDKIRDWIDDHKGSNIKDLKISRNPENRGTVYNTEMGFSLASGDYGTLIAADDVYYSNDVFETFIDELERLGKDAMIVAGQVAMMDSTLTKNQYDFVGKIDKTLLEGLEPQQLFEELSLRCFYPAVCFWRKGLHNIVGKLSDHYRMIEDWTQSLRLSRQGIKLHYLDVYMMKHRDGGISHGNKKGTSKSYMYYVNDNIEAYKREILPYIADFSSKSVEEILRIYSYWVATAQPNNKGAEEDSGEDATEEESKQGTLPEYTLVSRGVRAILRKMINVLTIIYNSTAKAR